LKKFFFLLLICFSCEFNESIDKNHVARVGDNYLNYSELNKLIPSKISPSDSISLANKIILEWATSELLIQSAQINLSENEKILIDKKSEKYRDNLILSEYKNKISENNTDTLISEYEIQDFFEKNSKNFKLYNEIVKGRYLKLNNSNFNINEIKRRFSRFNTIDKSFFDSISIQLLNYSFDDSTWIDKSLFFNKIPSLNEDEIRRIVKNNLFYIKEDSLALYLIKINKYKKANEYAPLDYIYGRIRELIANRKRIDYLKRIEKELIDDAIAKNIYEKID
tara:strand:- start:130 stop:969 length:840 start_codon:yes stop_codon:yes gene_type:complete